ncbi:MAG: alpha/beta hydrolase [Myxococcales bacterium]|nr:alpha/beta hydrolase [Myxococcales bacterium]
MKRPYTLTLLGLVVAACGAEPGAVTEDAALARSPSCNAYYRLTGAVGAATGWCAAGKSFSYDGLEIFYTCMGPVGAPRVYLNHGWPTSSFDFEAIMTDLAQDHRVCALDTPGYGFSDKPATGYAYSILKDADLVAYFLSTIMGGGDVALLTHDKGDSVGLELLHDYLAARAGGEDPGYHLTHHFILNGSIHLDEADLSGLQLALLDPRTGPPLAQALTGPLMASAVGGALYTPDLTADEQAELASVFDYQDGTDVLDQTIQYLDERAEYEDTRWLAALAETDVPTSLVWGELDTVAVPAVADYAWCSALAFGAAPAWYWRLPAGDHYVQHDRPGEVAGIVRSTLAGNPQLPPSADPDAAYLYARSGEVGFCP